MLVENSSSEKLKQDAANLIGQLRETSPRVHCLTNSVAQTFTANVLLALGAEPSMTIAPEEISSFVVGADTTLINLGTLDADRRTSAVIAAETAVGAGKPFVLDPVFAHRSPSRKLLAEKIIKLAPTVVRGNAEELCQLAARGSQTVDVQTGSEDLVQFQNKKASVYNGHPYMAATTAMGCALGAVMAATLVAEERPFQAVTGALLIFGVAGELAAKKAMGPGSFVPAFIDTLASISSKDIEKYGRLS